MSWLFRRREEPAERIEPPLKTKSDDTTADALLWRESLWSVPSVTGIRIDQQSALNASAVMACVTMLAEDVAKLTPKLWRRSENGRRVEATDHWLYQFFTRPNDWQSWFEFAEMLLVGLIMRGNAYFVILRNARGQPTTFVPINPDRVALWESGDGELFYRVTPSGLHELALLSGMEQPIHSSDIMHIRGFSLNGLLGASRISLAREAIGLALGQEQQQARWMANGANPSGVLSTDKELTPGAAERMAADWKASFGGLQNHGRVPVLEQGLTFEKISMSAADLEFISSRQFQVQEIARIFRVPPHMIGELSRSTNNNIAQQAQEYANYTIAGYTERLAAKFAAFFSLHSDGVEVDFDLSKLLRADIQTRYANYRTGIMSMFLTPNEARLDDGRDPIVGGDVLYSPQNMAAAGSQSTGTAPDDAGRPPQGTTP